MSSTLAGAVLLLKPAPDLGERKAAACKRMSCGLLFLGTCCGITPHDCVNVFRPWHRQASWCFTPSTPTGLCAKLTPRLGSPHSILEWALLKAGAKHSRFCCGYVLDCGYGRLRLTHTGTPRTPGMHMILLEGILCTAIERRIPLR